MTTKFFKLDIDIVIEPVGTNPPHVLIFLDDVKISDLRLQSMMSIKHTEMLAQGPHHLEIQLVDKSNFDPDQALKIKKITINGMSDDRFIWKAIYFPDYPEP